MKIVLSPERFEHSIINTFRIL